MSTDIDPCRGTLQLENESFAIDCNGKVSKRVIDDCLIETMTDGSAKVQIVTAGGTPVWHDVQTVTNPGTEQTLISETVPASMTRTLNKIRVTCRQRVSYTVLIDGSIVGSGRVGAGKYSDDFIWVPGRDAAENLDYEVKVLQSDGPATDIEVYLMVTES